MRRCRISWGFRAEDVTNLQSVGLGYLGGAFGSFGHEQTEGT